MKFFSIIFFVRIGIKVQRKKVTLSTPALLFSSHPSPNSGIMRYLCLDHHMRPVMLNLTQPPTSEELPWMKWGWSSSVQENERVRPNKCFDCRTYNTTDVSDFEKGYIQTIGDKTMGIWMEGDGSVRCHKLNIVFNSVQRTRAITPLRNSIC